MVRKSSFQKCPQLLQEHQNLIQMLEEYVRGELSFNSMLTVILQNFNIGPDFSSEIEILLKDLARKDGQGVIDDLLEFVGILQDMKIRFAQKFDFVTQAPAESDPAPDKEPRRTVLKFIPNKPLGRGKAHGPKGSETAANTKK